MPVEWPPRRGSPWDNTLKAYIDELVASKRPVDVPIPLSELATGGVPSSMTFLRGDGTWATLDGSVGGGSDDTLPPSIPANVHVVEVRSTSARVAWDSATDNVNVTGYELSINGVAQAGPITTLFADLSSLSSSTNYTVRVRARDAAGNWSPQSTSLILTTLASASLGYPDASNSPYMDGEGLLHYFPNFPIDAAESTQVLTPYSGVYYSTSDDQVIEGLYLNGGSIVIRHQNVTVRRCYLKCTTSFWNAVIVQTGSTVATSINYEPIVEDCCVDGNDVPGGAGLVGIGLTVRRCNIFRCDNSAQGEDAQLWEDNFFHDAAIFTAEAHTDLIQFDGSVDWPVRNWTARHNTFLSRTVDGQGTTSCIITNQDPLSGVMANILIEDNIFAGGAFALYGPSRLMADFELRNNKFWTLYYPSVGAFGESGNAVELMNTTGNSVGAFAGGLVNNVIAGSWVHDHFLGTPGGSSDTTAPSIPTSLASADISADGFTVTWSASTDNVGVTGYEVYLDGVSQGVVSVTSKTFTGLTGGTSYAVRVRARDAAANWSAQSTALNVMTLADSSYLIKSVTISSSLPSAGTQLVTTGEDIATEVGDFVMLLQFSDYRLKANVGLPVANSSITATVIDFPGVDNANKFRVSYYYAAEAGVQTIEADTSGPTDADKRMVAIVISGVDGVDPIDVFNSTDSVGSVNGGLGENFYQTPAVTTTGPDKLVVSIVCASASRTYVSCESGYTLLNTESAVGGFFSYSIIYGVKASSGDTGTIDHLYSSSATGNAVCTLALNA